MIQQTPRGTQARMATKPSAKKPIVKMRQVIREQGKILQSNTNAPEAQTFLNGFGCCLFFTTVTGIVLWALGVFKTCGG